MNLEEAIRTALNFENKVRAVYLDAARKAKDSTGKRVFEVLADEEQGHVEFLEKKLSEWRTSGKVTAEKLTTVVPSQDVIRQGIKAMKHGLGTAPDRSEEIELLKKALTVELETGAFYKRMVTELDAEGSALFQPFVVIEDGHYAIVQAQLDALNGMGFWFDFMEFQLEAG
jgi:rubrerythrin